MSSTGMPVPGLSDWTKASKEELVDEVLNLRLYVASLYLELQTFKRNGELSHAAHVRIATLEQEAGWIPEIRQRMRELEERIASLQPQGLGYPELAGRVKLLESLLGTGLSYSDLAEAFMELQERVKRLEIREL